MDERRSLLPHRVQRPANYLGDANDFFALAPHSEFFRFLGEHLDVPRRIRKNWEWDYIAETAGLLGYLDGRSSAAGLGVASEPLCYYFAARCGQVLATDVYSEASNWKAARVANLDRLYDAPYKYPREKLTFKNADMRELPLQDASVDFVWSSSSIEHVPSIRDTYRVYEEILRVLKPGGHAILTTEFCITEPPYLLRSLNALDEFLFRDVVQSMGALKPTGPTDLRFNSRYPGNALRARRYVISQSPHQPLHPTYQPTSMVQVLGISAIVPIGFVLQKTGERLTPWEDLQIPETVRIYSNALEALTHQKSSEACDLLSPFYHRGPVDISLQFYFHISLVYLEALLLSTNSSRERFLAEVPLILDHLPKGELQDGDLLNLVAFHLAGFGEIEKAAQLYGMAALSPSTLPEISVALALRHLQQMTLLEQRKKGLDLVSELLADLVASGTHWKYWLPAVQKGLVETEQSEQRRKEAIEYVERKLKIVKELHGANFDISSPGGG